MIKSIEGYSYKVNEWIGKGYSSTVHKGKRENTGQDVSLKVIEMSKLQDPINQMLLQYQISALKSLTSSSHVLQLYDVYGTRNNTYIITELMQGDLHNLLKQRKQFPYYEAVEIVKQIITGYYDVYKNGYLHRDIKPANIFFKKNTYKIGDFGFAIPATDAHNHRHYNVGSPVYMPPEALKENIFTPTCDTWAIGIIFYQLLKGITPWRAVSEQKLYDKIINQPLNQLTLGLPEIARVFLSRVLNLDSEKRMCPQELITWSEKLFSVQIRGCSQTKISSQKIPLRQIVSNNLHSQNQSQFYSRSKSYSSNQIPNYVSGLRINFNNRQINSYQTQNSQVKSQTNTLLFPHSTNRNNLTTFKESAKQPVKFCQKTSTFLTPQDLIQNENQQQLCNAQSVDVKLYASNMISYLKFIHRVIKFISNPTQIPLKDLQDSLIKFLFKQIEAIKGYFDSEKSQISNQIPGWKQFISSSEFGNQFKEPLNLLTKKYKMFLVRPNNQFISEVHQQKILDGIKKVFSHFQKGNISDKSLISLDYLVSFYQVWEYREKKGNYFNFKEFLEFSSFDKIMSCSPYDVKNQHYKQLKNKMEILGLIGNQILTEISVGFRSNQVKEFRSNQERGFKSNQVRFKQLVYENKQNYLKVPMRN